MDEAKTFLIEDAQIIFRNFEGKEGKYNRKGDRNFTVILDEVVAQQMEKDGWNVKYLNPREEDAAEGALPKPIIQVAVNFENRPPQITMITSVGRNRIHEDSVDVLDFADIRTVDLLARGFDWDVNGKSGTKAYLKTMFVTMEEDELERKYASAEE